MYKVAIVFVLLSHFISENVAYFITVDAHEEQCFFDKVEAGTKMGLFLKEKLTETLFYKWLL